MDEPIRVLHVDDDPEFTEVTSAFLERQDGQFSVESVTTPDEGLARLARDGFDCVVSDYEMPGRTGIEFLQTVRKEYPDLPFLLFTGKGSEEIASEAISAGVTDYLQKKGSPDQYTVLANRIENAVDRYRTERELDATRMRYQQVVEQNLAGIYITQYGEIVFVNPKLAEIFGYERKELIGMSPLDVIAPEERDRVRENLRQRFEGEVRDLQYQTVVLTKDGERIDVELHGARIEYGGEPAVIGTLIDITDRKRHERQLERQNERLEQFASVVSHDLRNPLNVVKTRLELARAECGDCEHFEPMARGIDRMETLIENLLALAREGDQVGRQEPVDIAAVVEDCWLNVETADAGIEVDVERRVMADPSRLQQLLENLVRNAVEHGGSDVTITVGERADGFYLEDDGPGIPPEDRENLFDPGYSTVEDGVGFGLTIVETVAEGHGWDVRVTDGTSGGTRFEFADVEFAP